MSNYKEKLRNIKTLIFDYDGVLSDGTVSVLGNGEHVRTGYVKDGYAIQLALKKDLRIVVISGGISESMEIRCRALGIQDAFLGVNDKTVTFHQYIKDHQLSKDEI
jgi:3-deoxy-D-manno-octulosonate 8-phosphate phosphatase (KDO 8-P phosphatase)